MNKTDHTQKIFRKTLEKLIDIKYITVADYVSLDGVASIIAADLYDFEKEEEKRKKISIFIQIMEEYFPDKTEKFFKESQK